MPFKGIIEGSVQSSSAFYTFCEIEIETFYTIKIEEQSSSTTIINVLRNYNDLEFEATCFVFVLWLAFIMKMKIVKPDLSPQGTIDFVPKFNFSW